MLQDIARDMEVHGLEKALRDYSRAKAASRRRVRALHAAAVKDARLTQRRPGPRKSKAHTQQLITQSRPGGAQGVQWGAAGDKAPPPPPTGQPRVQRRW